MAKKQKLPEWLPPVAIVLTVVLIWIVTSLPQGTISNIFYSSPSYCHEKQCYTTQQEYQNAIADAEFEELMEEAEVYKKIADENQIEAIETMECFENQDNILELNNCIDRSRIALGKYEAKLKDLRAFVENNQKSFDDYLEAIDTIDGRLSWVYAREAEIENLVNYYNHE